jgi:ubiquinone/menaquinone biosynthesis C-methylase UbiE
VKGTLLKSNIRRLSIEYFSKQKRVYSEKRASREPILSWLLDYIPKNRAFRVLNIGCGDGSLSYIIVSRKTSCYVVGIDLCRPLISIGQRRTRHGNARVNYIIADVTELPFRRDTFDMSYAVTVLHHVYGRSLEESRRMQRIALKEISRVTKRLFLYVNYFSQIDWGN